MLNACTMAFDRLVRRSDLGCEMDFVERWVVWLDKQIPPGHWHDKIYSYCERGGDASFWAEPINAVSNGAFLIAAGVALVLWLRGAGGERRVVDLLLILLVAVIGIGSFLFHTLASRWAAVADVAPITVFMLAYFGYALRRFFAFPLLVAILGVGLFYGVLSAADGVQCDGGRCLNGSLGYVPAFVVLLVCGVALLVMRKAAGWSLVSAGLIFGVSLTFRTFDLQWCSMLSSVDGGPLGTHFAWHCLNALLLFLLLRAAVYHGGHGGSRR